MSDNEKILVEFCGITGSSLEDGRFFLDSAVWNLEDAVASYYESGGSSSAPAAATSPPAVVMPPEEVAREKSPVVTRRSGRSDGSGSRSQDDFSRIVTMASLKRYESSSDEEEGQRFFAGGSVHSGQEVVGPPGRSNAEFISDLFQSVRELGGVETPPVRSAGKFRGVGYRLGQTQDDSEVVGQPSAERRELTLRLWRDGFSINNEELRSYTDPDDREFLRKIKSGQVPPELAGEALDETLHLNIEDHQHENFPKNKVKSSAKAFTGVGHVLGSVSPNVIVNSESQTAIPTPPSSLPSAPKVDNNAPTTTIAVRLDDGSRIQTILNTTHTITDLRNSILNLRPELLSSAFSLLSAFPIKELSDESLTLEQAGVLNSSVLLRIKK